MRRSELLRGPVAAAVWAVAVAVAFAWGHWLRVTGRETEDALPPFYAVPKLPTWQLLPAVAVAALGVLWLPVLARRLSWTPLLLTGWASAAVWAVALAASDGWSAIAEPLTSRNEYLAGLTTVRADPLRWLAVFTSELPSHPVHVRGHPPLPMLFLWSLDAVGLRGPTWAALVIIAVGCSSVAAIAVTLRSVAGEATARGVLPFLVLAPYAVWIATAMDALFLGVAAWGVALLSRRARAAYLVGGVTLGTLPYLSYGLLPVLAVPLVVLLLRGPPVRSSWRPALRDLRRPALVVVAGMAVVPLLSSAAGFWWPDGVTATHQAYLAAGGSSRRPYGYFLFANMAVLALLVGPAVAAVLPQAVAVARASLARRAAASHTPALVTAPFTDAAGTGATVALAGAALLGVLALDLSGVTRGEVERIWVPYAAWISVAVALHRPPARGWLATQALTALALQAFVGSAW